MPNDIFKTTLPDGIQSRYIDNGNNLSGHILETGFDHPDRPCVLLLHGFLNSHTAGGTSYAQAGYHVIDPDQRGYGRKTGWDANYDGDLSSFRMKSAVTLSQPNTQVSHFPALPPLLQPAS